MRCAAWQTGQTLEVRRPSAVRPWQHVLDPLAGYLTLAQKLWEQPALAGAYNFGPDSGEAVSVRDVVELARATFGEGEARYGDGSEGPARIRMAWFGCRQGKERAWRYAGVNAGTGGQTNDGLVPRPP